MEITREQYDNHDCHLSAEDSCKACYLWEEQCERCEDLRCSFWGFHRKGCAFREQRDEFEERNQGITLDIALGK